MPDDDLSRYGQAQAGASGGRGARTVHAEKSLEKPWNGLGWDVATVILDDDDDVLGQGFRR
jgi:hypothetical protein